MSVGGGCRVDTLWDGYHGIFTSLLAVVLITLSVLWATFAYDDFDDARSQLVRVGACADDPAVRVAVNRLEWGKCLVAVSVVSSAALVLLAAVFSLCVSGANRRWTDADDSPYFMKMIRVGLMFASLWALVGAYTVARLVPVATLVAAFSTSCSHIHLFDELSSASRNLWTGVATLMAGALVGIYWGLHGVERFHKGYATLPSA